MSDEAPRRVVDIGVGIPAWYRLNRWGQSLYDAFGERPYLVGSAARAGKDWNGRDVDVVVMLSEERFKQLFGDVAMHAFNPRWAAYAEAFSAWGLAFTGLPIDFKVQENTSANAEFDGVRCPLGIMPHRPYAEPWDEDRLVEAAIAYVDQVNLERQRPATSPDEHAVYAAASNAKWEALVAARGPSL